MLKSPELAWDWGVGVLVKFHFSFNITVVSYTMFTTIRLSYGESKLLTGTAKQANHSIV